MGNFSIAKVVAIVVGILMLGFLTYQGTSYIVGRISISAQLKADLDNAKTANSALVAEVNQLHQDILDRAQSNEVISSETAASDGEFDVLQQSLTEAIAKRSSEDSKMGAQVDQARRLVKNLPPPPDDTVELDLAWKAFCTAQPKAEPCVKGVH